MKHLFLAAALSFTALSGCSDNPTAPNQPETKAEAKAETAADVVAALKASGLPVGDVTVITAATDSNKLLGRPNQYTSKADFYDTRHPVNADKMEDPVHTVEVFVNAEDAKARHDYVENVTKGVGFLTQYQILEGKVLLRMDKAMLPDETEQYRAALKKIAG